MTDSIRVLDDNYVQRIHSSRVAGKLHKGHSIAAASASIPSRYQTIVTDNSDRKGFSSKAKRFSSEHHDENPGPGTYVNHATMDKISPSFSKKGTGGFASKDRRIQKQFVAFGPGSNTYALTSTLVSRKDFNQANSSRTFHKPIAEPRDRISDLPAPNQYDVMKMRFGKANNVVADAAFKSQSKREVINVKEASKMPAPWQYHVSDELQRDSVKVPFSSFKSTSDRKMMSDPTAVPGPGTYKPHEAVDPAKKTLFPRKHYLCISAPAMPLPPAPTAPGPGSYEVVDYEGPPKHYMSSSVFVSSTSRWTGDNRQQTLPGPAHYRPLESGKQSFIYNAGGRWI